MKYIEELNSGDCFYIQPKYFIVTMDFKKSGQRLCVNLKDGSNIWMDSAESVENIDIFSLDKDNNMIAMKERDKDSVSA